MQNGRIHFNWLGQGGEKYPRYAKVREEFSSILERFFTFVAGQHLGDIRPNQWEVIYLNHISMGTVWKTPRDWGFFKPLGTVPTFEHLIEGESFGGAWHFVIPRDRGRLHVEWQHAKKSKPDPKETVVLTFTARGPLAENTNGIEAVLQSVDLGHDIIVRSFANLMSEDANKFWGLKHAND